MFVDRSSEIGPGPFGRASSTEPGVCRFVVPGRALGKERPRLLSDGRVVTPTQTREQEQRVAGLARAAMDGREPFTGPVAATYAIRMQVSATWTPDRKAAALAGAEPPISGMHLCDTDNVEKLLADAAVKGGVMVNDRQIVATMVTRRWGPVDETTCTFRQVQRVTVDAVAFRFDAGAASAANDDPHP